MKTLVEDYDLVVVGAGHAGCEAALAGARLGLNTVMFTSSGFRREPTAICSAMRQPTRSTTGGFTRRSFPASAGKSVSVP